MAVKLVPRRQIPSTHIPCQRCGRMTRFARTALWPEGITDIFDPDEELESPDAAITVRHNESLLYRRLKEHDPAPRRPEEYGARFHKRTCPGAKDVPVPEVDTVVLPFERPTREGSARS